jgi:hypothetical protein
MKHTILFNIASRTILGLSPLIERRVTQYINDVMNGDGLYEGASQEIILEAYADQHMVPWKKDTWVELISEILNQTDENGQLNA